MARKSWFAARLLFVAETNGALEADALCEESIVLVRAANDSEASRAASRKGKEMEHGYQNADGDRIDWRLAGAFETQDLCERSLNEGVEVYSHLFFESQSNQEPVRRLLKGFRTSRNGRPARRNS